MIRLDLRFSGQVFFRLQCTRSANWTTLLVSLSRDALSWLTRQDVVLLLGAVLLIGATHPMHFSWHSSECHPDASPERQVLCGFWVAGVGHGAVRVSLISE